MNPDRAASIVGMVKRSRNGVTTASVAAMEGISLDHAKRILSMLCLRGEIAQAGRSVTSVWCSGERRGAVVERIKLRQEEAERKRRARQNLSRRTKALRAWLDGRPIRRVLPAALAKPPATRAVRSVFELATECDLE